MSSATRIAVLEDNAALREDVVFLLHEEGYAVEAFGTAADFFRAHRNTPFDLLLLDLGLPDQDGIDVAQELLHSQDGIGIIMLTARGGLGERVGGLTAGADAYLTKPFDLAELLAHIHALMRRKNYRAGSVRWRVELSRYQLLAPNAVSALELTPNEACILRQLARHHPEYAPRAELVTSLGENYLLYDERRLEQIVSRLRKKIHEHYAANPIKAVRGRGYVFNEPIELVERSSSHASAVVR
ncbi:response regulator transcription factor [Marinobacterium sp. D7]|uniref:response regulator transcription factor n=1 Tax=Marinobacterium ramblicola TaxID=2849041 RepID=UPI001C2D212A|nr:response regulator transcription factor [Marinobacterium ramblicola]MBV1786439.1 response regulator transcription factor [Marinobacterium ramblicola]